MVLASLSNKAWPEKWRQIICQESFASTSSDVDSLLILSSPTVRQPYRAYPSLNTEIAVKPARDPQTFKSALYQLYNQIFLFYCLNRNSGTGDD